jgi:hypothetical protein
MPLVGARSDERPHSGVHDCVATTTGEGPGRPAGGRVARYAFGVAVEAGR